VKDAITFRSVKVYLRCSRTEISPSGAGEGEGLLEGATDDKGLNDINNAITEKI
jgi:hypothetical protein